MRARHLIEELPSRGRYLFTLGDAIAALSADPLAVRAQLRRLKSRNLVAEPVRGFFAVLPPEYRRLGCLPAEQFVPQLLASAGEPYYLALLSAAERHGAAHQSPQVVQFMVRRNRERIECGQVRAEFIARRDLERMPVTEFNTPRGVVRCSTPEVTALELLGYPGHAGGLNNVATVLTELAEVIDGEKLVAAARLCPVSWAQRLGYVMEIVGREALASVLRPLVSEYARSYTPLRRAAKTAGGRRVAAWKLIVNAEVEPDL